LNGDISVFAWTRDREKLPGSNFRANGFLATMFGKTARLLPDVEYLILCHGPRLYRAFYAMIPHYAEIATKIYRLLRRAAGPAASPDRFSKTPIPIPVSFNQPYTQGRISA